MATLHNKKFISADFEEKFVAHFFKRFANFLGNFFLLKIDRNENCIMQCGHGEQTLWKIFFYVSIIGAYEANSPLQKSFVIFLKGATDFIDTRLSN